ELLARLHGFLVEAGRAVHLRPGMDAMPMDGGRYGELVAQRDADEVALAHADLRARGLAVVAPCAGGDTGHDLPVELLGRERELAGLRLLIGRRSGSVKMAGGVVVVGIRQERLRSNATGVEEGGRQSSAESLEGATAGEGKMGVRSGRLGMIHGCSVGLACPGAGTGWEHPRSREGGAFLPTVAGLVPAVAEFGGGWPRGSVASRKAIGARYADERRGL